MDAMKQNKLNLLSDTMRDPITRPRKNSSQNVSECMIRTEKTQSGGAGEGTPNKAESIRVSGELGQAEMVTQHTAHSVTSAVPVPRESSWASVFRTRS